MSSYSLLAGRSVSCLWRFSIGEAVRHAIFEFDNTVCQSIVEAVCHAIFGFNDTVCQSIGFFRQNFGTFKSRICLFDVNLPLRHDNFSGVVLP